MTRAGQQVTEWVRQRPDRAVALFLAVISYVPMLLTEPGRVSADTKTYLTVDPAAVLAQASSMWDPSVGAGTVPHQNIGYLFPLGPYYWLMEQLAVPDWLTQRLLWGTLVFAAAFGTYRLVRWLGWGVSGALVAGVGYGLSPYLLSYLARLSVILAPWAALPWMILLAAKAARTRSWRPAAHFALVVAVVGSVNATALVLAGLGPVIWLVTDVLSGRVRVMAAVAGAARIGVLSLVVSMWWIVALRIQGSWGIPILRYTETYESVASASTPAEIMRGLGYWFFYGGDRLDTWVGPSLPYTDHPVVMAVGFTLAGLALLGFLTSFAGRVSATVLLVIGLAVSVGAAPLGSSSPYGSLFEWFVSDTTAGLALRSTPRAAPLVILALAFGAASTSEWLRSRLAERSPAAAPSGAPAARSVMVSYAAPVGMIALFMVQLFPWFTGNALTPSLLRDESLPPHVTELADWLDETGDGRVWEIPASDFANTRWGGTVDPVLPGLIDRPYLARELVPQGGDGTADLLNAFERRIPEGWFEPETLPAIADRFGVHTVVVRNDLEHERYRLARPGPLWTDVTGSLDDPDFVGPLVTDQPVIPILDERTLTRPDAADQFPVNAAFDRPVATPVITTATAAAPIVLAGSGDGLVDVAGAGLLDLDRPVLYAATLADRADDGDLDPDAIGTDPWWLVTDSNRKQGRHWSTVSANLGALEGAGPLQLDDDPGDNRLDVFDELLDRQTIGVHVADVADVRASYYGYRVAYTPEDAPWFALDGDPTTAWRTGVFDEVDGLLWEVDLREPSDADQITLLQPVTGATSRFITRVRVTLDGSTEFDVDLDDRSRALPGQPIDLPTDRFESLRIEILADNLGEISSYIGQPGVGLAEVTIPGVVDDRVVRVPSLDAFGIVDEAALAEQRVSMLFTRQRIDPATSNQTSAEPFLTRVFTAPDDRTFELSGELRLSADASDRLLLDVLDDPNDVVADRRVRGNPDARGASAIDGDLSTAWQTPFDDAPGATLSIGHPQPVAVDSLTVTWLDDGRHSPPSRLSVTGDDGEVRVVDVPATAPVDGVATATVALSGYETSRSSLTIDVVDERTTPEYFSGVPQVLPVGLAEVQFGDAPNPTFDRTGALDDTCRNDLLTLDGAPVAVRVAGTRDEALQRAELRLEGCGPVDLVSGEHRVDATAGSATGFDVDRVLIDGAPASSTAPDTASPNSVMTAEADTHLTATVEPFAEQSWLILEQSWNPGWTATVDGDDLGTPVLIDGYANGWLLPAAAEERTVELTWTPQRTLTFALWFSLIAGIGVLGLAIFGRRRAFTPDRTQRAATDPRIARLTMLAGLTVTFGFLAGPIPAVVALFVGAIEPRLRWLAPTIVLVAGAAAAGAIIALEWRYDYPPGPDWPDRFGWTAPLVWSAVAAVSAAAVADRPRVSMIGNRESPPLS